MENNLQRTGAYKDRGVVNRAHDPTSRKSSAEANEAAA
jgi:hypothetical protein